MKKGIIIHDNVELRKLISINLEMYTDTALEPFPDADSCTEYLKKNQDVSLIITKNNMKDESTALKVFYYVSSNKLNIPIICFGYADKLSSDDLVKVMDEPSRDMSELIRTAGKLMSVTAEEMIELQVDDYYPVSLRHFTMLASSPVDVFQKNNLDKAELLFKKNSPIPAGEVKEMLLDGVDHLYVGKYDRLKFVNNLSEQTIKKIEKSDLKGKDRIEASMALFDASKEMIAQSGLNEQSITAAKATIKTMMETVNATKELSELMALLESMPGSYLYKHSMLAALICHHALGEMEFATKQQRETICFVAYFHDITLNDDRLAAINSKKQLKAEKLRPKAEKKVMEHAFRAVQLIENYPNVPFGALELITQHHGQNNGIGFNDSMPMNLSPAAIVFMVVEQYVDLLIKKQEDPEFNLKVAKERMSLRYKKGFYQSTMDVINKMNP